MRFVVAWLVLAGFWLALAGVPHGVVHWTFALASVSLVSLWVGPLLFDGPGLGPGFRSFGRLVAYSPWLLWQILVANIDVFLRVFGLRPVDPRVVSFESDLESDFAKVALANSITLTPGTVTIGIEGRIFVVHAIAPSAAHLLRTGEMQRHVKRLEGHDA